LTTNLGKGIWRLLSNFAYFAPDRSILILLGVRSRPFHPNYPDTSEKEVMMLKKSMALILTLLLLAAAGPVVAEEMAREGSNSAKVYWTGTFTALPMGKELAQINYEGHSVRVSDNGKGLLHNATGHVVGGYLVVKGVYKNDTGLICYTRPDGDQVFFTYKCSGASGKSAKGTATIVGGTGKLVGITGTGEFTRYSLRPPAKGVFASFAVLTGSWKLPEKK
jgi:hypothetical protein